MDILSLASYMGDVVNWTAFFMMVRIMGNDLNSRKDRFDKASIIEYALEIFSGGKIKWIDDIGVDHIIPEHDIKTEMKFIKTAKYTSVNRSPRKSIKVKLTNTIGSSEGRTLPNTFDYLIVASEYDVSLIDRESLEGFVKSDGDGLSACIPFASLIEVIKMDDTGAKALLESFNGKSTYKKEKMEAMNRFLNQFI